MRAASQLRIVCHAIVAVTLCGIGTPSAVAKLKVDPAKAATLHIPKGYEKSKMLGGNTQLVFLAPETGACKGLKYVTGFDWSDKKGVVKQKLVPSGQRVTLYALGKINTDGGYNAVYVNSCARSVSFTPLQGGQYDFVQKIDLGVSCDVRLTDRATGLPPPDLEQIEGPFCRNL